MQYIIFRKKKYYSKNTDIKKPRNTGKSMNFISNK